MAQSEHTERLLYDIPQSAEKLNLSQRTVATLIASGALQSIKVGRRRLIPRQALDNYIHGMLAGNGSHPERVA